MDIDIKKLAEVLAWDKFNIVFYDFPEGVLYEKVDDTEIRFLIPQYQDIWEEHYEKYIKLIESYPAE